MAQQARVLLIEEHYRELGLDEHWTWSMAESLCGRLGCSTDELMALLRMSKPEIWKAKRRGFSGPASLHLHILEDALESISQDRPTRARIPAHIFL